MIVCTGYWNYAGHDAHGQRVEEEQATRRELGPLSADERATLAAWDGRYPYPEPVLVIGRRVATLAFGPPPWDAICLGKDHTPSNIAHDLRFAVLNLWQDDVSGRHTFRLAA